MLADMRNCDVHIDQVGAGGDDIAKVDFWHTRGRVEMSVASGRRVKRGVIEYPEGLVGR